MIGPRQLRVEHLGNAVLGIGERRPRLSWQLPDGASCQLAYCVRLDGRELAPVEGDTSVLVPWPGDGADRSPNNRLIEDVQ